MRRVVVTGLDWYHRWVAAVSWHGPACSMPVQGWLPFPNGRLPFPARVAGIVPTKADDPDDGCHQWSLRAMDEGSLHPSGQFLLARPATIFDDVRRIGFPQTRTDGSETGQTSSFLAMNRDKRSVALDMDCSFAKRLSSQANSALRWLTATGSRNWPEQIP